MFQSWTVFLLIVVVHVSFHSPVVFAYAPLGSEPIEKCEVYGYDCPSHFMCVTYDRSTKYGECRCDRFYGFYGPTCEKLSAGSYLLIAMCVTCFLLTYRSLLLNLNFAYRLHQRGSLQRNSLCRCLFFNIFATFPVLVLAVGNFMGATSIDKQMFYDEFILIPMLGLAAASFVLSTMSISFAWVETVEKTKRMPHSERNYKLKLYSTALLALTAGVVAYSYSMAYTASVFGGLLIFFSYVQAKRMVTEALSVMEDNGDIIVYRGAADILRLIKLTSRKMMAYTLLISLSALVLAFTIMLPVPKYKEQNSLPRYAQGQLGFLLAGLSFYKINITVREYLEASAKRHLDRPVVNSSECCDYLDCLCSCLCCYCPVIQISSPMQQPSPVGQSIEESHVSSVSNAKFVVQNQNDVIDCKSDNSEKKNRDFSPRLGSRRTREESARLFAVLSKSLSQARGNSNVSALPVEGRIVSSLSLPECPSDSDDSLANSNSSRCRDELILHQHSSDLSHIKNCDSTFEKRVREALIVTDSTASSTNDGSASSNV